MSCDFAACGDGFRTNFQRQNDSRARVKTASQTNVDLTSGFCTKNRFVGASKRISPS